MILAFVIISALLLAGPWRHVGEGTLPDGSPAPGRMTPLDGALSRGTSDMLKGVCILLVVLRHFLGYFRESGAPFTSPDYYAFTVNAYIGQLPIVVFFFFSGYGIAEAFRRDRAGYLGRFPRHRLLRLYLAYASAAAVFIITYTLLGEKLTAAAVGGAFLLTEVPAFHLWFAVTLLYCYAATYAAFRIFRDDRAATVAVSVLCAGYILLSYLRDLPYFYYDTVLCYPAGMAVSLMREKAAGWLEGGRSGWRYAVMLAILAVAFLLTFPATLRNGWSDPLRLIDNANAVLWILLALMAIAAVYRVAGRRGRPVTRRAVPERYTGHGILRRLGRSSEPVYYYHVLPLAVAAGIGGGIAYAEYPGLLLPAALLLPLTIKRQRRESSIQ